AKHGTQPSCHPRPWGSPLGKTWGPLWGKPLAGTLHATMSTYATPAPRRFAELRASEVPVRCSARSIVIQPIASIEQHGPHLPLATDLMVCEASAEAAVAQRGDELDLWLLPSLAYGKSNEHAWAAGTIWLSAQTLLAVLDDLGRAIMATPARRLVFVN